MRRARPGDRVTIHYIGTLDNGRIFDQRDAEDPLQIVLGEAQIFPDLETQILGMAPGEAKNIHLRADQAFGVRKQENLLRVPRDMFPPNRQLQVGEKLALEFGDQSQRAMRIRAVDAEEVVLDGNHDLAGCDLTFALQLVEIVRP